jgi:hypothetical protein
LKWLSDLKGGEGGQGSQLCEKKLANADFYHAQEVMDNEREKAQSLAVRLSSWKT